MPEREACSTRPNFIISSPSMNTERELHIDAHIKKCPDALMVNKEPVFIHGKLHELDVFRLPTKLLVFNIGNGRFAAESIAAEKRLNRKLDTTKADDVKVIQQRNLPKGSCLWPCSSTPLCKGEA